MAQCLTHVLSTAVKKSLGVVTAKGKQGGVDKLSVQNTDMLTEGPNTFTKFVFNNYKAEFNSARQTSKQVFARNPK